MCEARFCYDGAELGKNVWMSAGTLADIRTVGTIPAKQIMKGKG